MSPARVSRCIEAKQRSSPRDLFHTNPSNVDNMSISSSINKCKAPAIPYANDPMVLGSNVDVNHHKYVNLNINNKNTTITISNTQHATNNTSLFFPYDEYHDDEGFTSINVTNLYNHVDQDHHLGDFDGYDCGNYLVNPLVEQWLILIPWIIVSITIILWI